MENLSLYADLQGVRKEEKKETFERLLTFSRLHPFTQRLAKNLSGGMKQKLGLSCSLIQKPDLLLLDEPTVGVDPLSRRDLWKIVSDLLQEPMTVLWSTSYLDEAQKCDLVLLLHEGRVLFLGPPGEMTQRLEGRTFLLEHLQEKKRELLSSLFQMQEVMDATVQSSAIRLVLKK